MAAQQAAGAASLLARMILLNFSWEICTPAFTAVLVASASAQKTLGIVHHVLDLLGGFFGHRLTTT